MGRLRKQAVFRRRPLSVRYPRLHHWLLHPAAILLRPPSCPEAALELLEHGYHYILHWLAVRWYQLVNLGLLRCRVHIAALSAQVSRQLVRQVQLHLVSGHGRGNPGPGVYFDVFRVWRRRKGDQVSRILGKQLPERQF
jgi:hypothetical protein